MTPNGTTLRLVLTAQSSSIQIRGLFDPILNFTKSLFVIQITTINGATVALDKKDIVIPQGIAHAVDRVMFPLPVGDLLQTLQSDRERRFTHFLRALFSSGLSDLLQNKGMFVVSLMR